MMIFRDSYKGDFMSSATDAIHLLDTLEKNGIKREAATELIDFLESRHDNIVTKQDIQDMVTKQDLQQGLHAAEQNLQAVKKDLQQGLHTAEQNLQQETGLLNQKIEALKQGQNWLKWFMYGGFTLTNGFILGLLTIMLYLHGDTKESQRELKAEMEQRFTKVEQRFTEMEQRFAEVEQRNIERHREIKELLQKAIK